jgi:hypothetical protein
MNDDSGNMSIDFLVGCTIFILAFVWVASMIPGMMVGVQSASIDFDAVAYRTGVMLIEDPGYPASPAWELYPGKQEENVTRFGLALTKERPNILSAAKVERFTCTTEINPSLGFEYPEDYHDRVIFGDYPYHFNISIWDIPRNETRVIGEIIPNNYGHIRRLAKIKTPSNTTINFTTVQKFQYRHIDPDTNHGDGGKAQIHRFSILINTSYLTTEIKDPAYQIDPARDDVVVNITDLVKTFEEPGSIDPWPNTIRLDNISIYTLEGGKMNYKRTFPEPVIDEVYFRDTNSSYQIVPPVENSISMRISAGMMSELLKGANYPIYVNLTFNLSQPATFLNNTYQKPFDYNYHPDNVTQPMLRDAIVEVAVW